MHTSFNPSTYALLSNVEQHSSDTDSVGSSQQTSENSRAHFIPKSDSLPKADQAQGESLTRLPDALALEKRRGDGWSLIPRILGGLSLGLVGVATTVAGGALAVVGGITGAVVSLPVALGKALVNADKGMLLRTMKEGAGIGASAGMKLARLPLEVLGYALKFPGALLSAIAKKISPPASEVLGKQLLAAHEQNQFPNGVLKGLEKSGTLDKLMASRPTGMSENDVKKQVLLGEQLVTQILNGEQTSLPADNESVTAIAWYLTAKGVQTTGETYTRGTFNWVDPDHKLMRFMASAPTCHGRISTHFASRSLSPQDALSRLTQDGLVSAFSKSPVQYGIEDFGIVGSLPNGMHAILFDRMESEDVRTGEKIPQTMMKLETIGMPTANRLFGHSDSSWDVLGKVGNMILSLSHCAQHGLNFISSRFESHSTGMTTRESPTKEAPGKAMLKFLDGALKASEGYSEEDKRTLSSLKDTLKKQGIDAFVYQVEELSTGKLKDKLMQVVKGQASDLAKRGEALDENGNTLYIRQGGEAILTGLGNAELLKWNPSQKMKQD